jgi:superfamily II DNA or RNA helicase
MSKTKPGLYDALITEALNATLATLDRSLVPIKGELRSAEASDRISLHVERLVARAISSLGDNERAKAGLALARRLVAEIQSAVDQVDVQPEQLIETGEVLQAIARRMPDGTPEIVAGPLIPLLDTTLLTNAPGEPRVGSQLATEIQSADAISIVMAFIRYSGLRPLLDALKKHCAAGKSLRVLTTIYTGSTEARALDELVALGATVRVSYDTTATRLHAKGWMFERHSGFSTAYIGSSNLTHSAQHDGLEWNVRISGARNPSVVEKLSAVFESYWSSPDFEEYKHDEFESRLKAQSTPNPTLALSPIELIPQPFQERLLEQIQVSRQLGHHRNLLVAATGTGKTVMAALDYAHLREELPRSRLLFVAHREEILQKSLDTFRVALRDHAFGELWVGGKRPASFEHVFASIQSLSATGLADLSADHFDVVIVDEFHHAAARSYTTLLSHIRPVELLGLTATPERGDGLPILHWFDNRIAAELRLWDAIEQHRLAPFAYYGIYDGVDLRDVSWKRGRGYDVDGLTNVLTADDARARLVAKQMFEHVSDVAKARALGFCVSVKHAQFMARVFNTIGIPSVAVSGETDGSQRAQALLDLQAGRINVVFSVDLFNEGVDVPAVDTLLLIRPTESATLFLQQLGRGLRKYRSKSACTVLDFVGQHRKEFRFDQRFRALLGGSRSSVIEQIKNGFPFLPAGCHMQLDRVASEIVIESIKRAIPSRWAAKVEELRSMRTHGSDVTLGQYLQSSGLDLEDVYESNHSWSELREAAGLPVASAGPENDLLRRACGRMLHIDDLSRIDTYHRFLSSGLPDSGALSTHDRRLLRMLVASVTDSALEKDMSLEDATRLLWSHPQIIAELREALGVLRPRVDHVHLPIEGQAQVPLQIHGRYTRTEILCGFGVGNAAMPPDWREGVRFAREARADLFVFTLDKTAGQFSPTTRYKDYAISRELVHWESQSTVREASETGRRYQNHVSMGTSVMLFARLRSDDRAFWFLGPATYVSHTGELPMAITWKLHYQLPGDLFAQFAAAVA